MAGIRHPEEELLAGLGRASRLFPELDDELHSAAPDTVTLDTPGAFRFLRETGPLLSGAGFGVLLPDWARKARLGLKMTTRSKQAAASGGAAQSMFGLADLVDFRYELALGDQTLDSDELAELARLKVPLVRLRGQWVELDDRHLQAALKFLARRRTGTMPAADALLAGLRGLDDDLPVVGVDADGWLGDLLSGHADQRLAPASTPASFRGELRPYQERGLAWLSFLGNLGLGGILADEMGLGKCIMPQMPVFLNGTLIAAQDVWDRFGKDARSDGEGEWAVPAQQLRINSLATSGGHETITTADVTRLYRQRISERVRRVRLDDGSEIALTRQHKLLGLHGWTNEFTPGDRICVPARLEWSGQPVDPDLTILLAWQIAEGHEDKYAVAISQKNVAVLESLRQCLHRLADSFQLQINRPSISEPASRVPSLRITSADYRGFLAGLGYVWGNRSAAKRIPDFIVAADDDTVRRFLREYFSAEGSAIKGMRSVEISSASEWLMRQLACMLRRFGIWLRVTEKQRCATNGSGIYRPYWIGLIGGISLRRFHAQVGFSDQVKQAKLADICAAKSNTNVEGIPGSDLLKLAHHLTGLPCGTSALEQFTSMALKSYRRQRLKSVIEAIDRILAGQAVTEYAARPSHQMDVDNPGSLRPP